MDKHLSNVIYAVKVPLTILVLLIHILPENYEAVSFKRSGTVYFFLSEMISHNMGRIAVPAFFLLSGYLFFCKGFVSFSFSEFVFKWKKRVYSVLIPYFIWNLLRIVAIYLKNGIAVLLNEDFDYAYNILRDSSIKYSLWNGPINGPLWYMRDLLIMFLFSPLLYLCYKTFNKWFLLLPLLFYLSTFEFDIKGFSSTAFLFFCLGGYWGYARKSILEIVRRRNIVVILAFFTLLLSTCMNTSVYHELIVRLFVPLGVLSIFIIFGALSDEKLTKIAQFTFFSFFVYMSHKIYILDWTNGLCFRLFGDSVLGLCVSYLIKPLIIIFLCSIVYMPLKRFRPRTLSFILGGR